MALFLAVYAIISFWLFPRLRSKFAIGSSPEQLLALAGIYGFWSFIRSFAAIGLAACSVVCLFLIFLVVNYGAIELVDINGGRKVFNELNKIISFVRPIWFLLAIILLVTGMAILSHRQMKQGVEKKIALEIDRRTKELLNQIDDWVHLPPTAEMSETLAAIQAADEYRQELESSDASGEIGPGTKQRLISEIRTKLGELTALYRYQDAERRIDFNDLTFDALSNDELNQKGFFSFFSKFLTDRFTIETISVGSRAIIAIGLLLTMLSTLGVATRTINNIVIERLSAWNLALNTLEGTKLYKTDNEAKENVGEIEKKLESLHQAVDKIDAQLTCKNGDDCHYIYLQTIYQSINSEYNQLVREIKNEIPKSPASSKLGSNLPVDISSDEFKKHQSELQERTRKVNSLTASNNRLAKKLKEAEIAKKSLTEKYEGLDNQIEREKDSIERLRRKSSKYRKDLNNKAQTREKLAKRLEKNARKHKGSIIGDRSKEALRHLHRRSKTESTFTSKFDSNIEKLDPESNLAKKLGGLKNKTYSKVEKIATLKNNVSKYKLANLSVLIEQMSWENTLARIRIDQLLNPITDQIIIKKAKALASQYFHQIFEPALAQAGYAKLSNPTIDLLKKGRADEVKQDILDRHKEQKSGGHVPNSYTRRADFPNDLKTLINVATKVAKDSQISFRETVIGFITEILIGSNKKDRERFSRNIVNSTPTKGSAFMGEFIKGIVNVSFGEITDVSAFGQTLKNSANDVLLSMNPKTLGQAFDPSKITKSFDKRTSEFSELDLTDKDVNSLTNKTKLYPPTFEGAPPSKEQVKEIKKLYEPFLSDIENQIKKNINGKTKDPKIVSQDTRQNMADVSQILTSATEGFDQLFPGQNPPLTDLEPIIDPSGPNKPNGSGSGNQLSIAQSIAGRYASNSDNRSLASASTHSFTRSRSYTRLRSFHRVGGVLIGRDPNGDNNLDIIAFNWEWNNEKSKLRLKLQDNSGKWYMSKWHDSLTVDLAMAYAADGRPTAVTMTTAKPLPELRINLHPTLVDTELGSSAVVLDRIVDKHAGYLRDDAEIYAQLIDQLYKLGHAIRLHRLALSSEGLDLKVSHVPPMIDSTQHIKNKVNELFSEFNSNFSNGNFIYFKKIYSKYLEGEQLFDRKYYFDESLVNQIKEAIINSEKPETFKVKLEKFYDEYFRKLNMSRKNISNEFSKNKKYFNKKVEDYNKKNKNHNEKIKKFKEKIKNHNEEGRYYNSIIKSTNFGIIKHPNNIKIEPRTPNLSKSYFPNNKIKIRDFLFEYYFRKNEIESGDSNILESWKIALDKEGIELNIEDAGLIIKESELKKEKRDLEKKKYELEKEKAKLLKKDAEFAIYTLKVLEKPPTFQVWSGVREKKYDLSIENILSDPKPDVLNFILQVSFTSNPLISKIFTDSELNEMGSAEHIDEKKLYPRYAKVEREEPWEFPAITPELRQKIQIKLSENKNESDAQVLKKMSDFIQLQRLFRSAFSGRLGDSFPMRQIVALDIQLAGNLEYPKHQTLRFNSGDTCHILRITMKKFQKHWQLIRQKKEKLSFLNPKDLQKIKIAFNKIDQSSNISTQTCKSELKSFFTALKSALDSIESVSDANKNPDQLLQIILLLKETMFSPKLRQVLVIENSIEALNH